MALASVILIHGYSGSPDKPRYHWLRGQLAERGIAMRAPTMPNPGHPIEADWLNEITHQVTEASKPIILVGHSLGGLAVLRWLEERATEPVFAAVSLAGVTVPQHSTHEHRTFSKDWSKPRNWDRIRSMAKHLVGIYSRDDTKVTPEEGAVFETKSGAITRWVDGRGHFSGDEITELPELLQAIETLGRLAM